MALWTCVARLTDGLPLVETWGDASHVSGRQKSEATELLTRARGLTSTRGSFDCAGGYVFHLFMGDGLSYLVLFERCYPPNLAWIFLEDVRQLVQEDLKREFGTGSVDHRSRIDTLEKPYAFQRLDRQIGRLRSEFQDPYSSKSIEKLKANLMEVTNVMKHNLDEVLLRGENLDSMSDKASRLKQESKSFSGVAQLLGTRAVLQRACAFVLVGLILVLELHENKRVKIVAQLVLGVVSVACLCAGRLDASGSLLSWLRASKSSDGTRYRYINLPSDRDDDADRLC